MAEQKCRIQIGDVAIFQSSDQTLHLDIDHERQLILLPEENGHRIDFNIGKMIQQFFFGEIIN